MLPYLDTYGIFSDETDGFKTRMGKRDPRTTSVSNVDEVLRSAEEFVRKNSSEFFLTNSSADPRTSSTLLTDVVLGSCLPPQVSWFSSRHSQTKLYCTNCTLFYTAVLHSALQTVQYMNTAVHTVPYCTLQYRLFNI